MSDNCVGTIFKYAGISGSVAGVFFCMINYLKDKDNQISPQVYLNLALVIIGAAVAGGLIGWLKNCYQQKDEDWTDIVEVGEQIIEEPSNLNP